jgi:hypothetical protein
VTDEAWTYDPMTGEPIIHLGPRDDATEQEALGDPWDEENRLTCDVTSCENDAVGGEIGEGGDLLLCADHLTPEVEADGRG